MSSPRRVRHHVRRVSFDRLKQLPTLNGKPVRVELVVRCGRKVERYPFAPFSRSAQQSFGRLVLAQALAMLVVRRQRPVRRRRPAKAKAA